MHINERLARRWISGTTLLGAGLTLLATLLHPITLNPWDTDLPVRFISENRWFWMWDHVLMAAAITLWLGGLAACVGLFGPVRRMTIVVSLLISSIAMWLLTLAFELGGMPISIDRLHSHADEAHRTIADTLFASALIAGYFAMIPAWLGVALGARSRWGAISGAIGAAGIVYSLLDPILWVLAATSALPFVWTITYAWRERKQGQGWIDE